MATTVLRMPKASLCDPLKRTVCLKMAASPYPLRFGVLGIPQQALVLKVLYDATEEGAFRFESAETVVFKVVTVVDQNQQRDKADIALRGWMQFTTSKNAKEFIKHWSKVIQLRLQSRETPLLIAVEHAVRPMDQEAFSVQKLMLDQAFMTSSGVHWGNLYRALNMSKFTLPPGDVRPGDAMLMPDQLKEHIPRLETDPVALDAKNDASAEAVHPSDFRIGAKAGPAGMQPYGHVPGAGIFHAATAPFAPFQNAGPFQNASFGPFNAPFGAVGNPPFSGQPHPFQGQPNLPFGVRPQGPFGARPIAPQHLMRPPAKQKLLSQPVRTSSALPASQTAAAGSTAAAKLKPAVPGVQQQAQKAAHLNTAAPAFVPRMLRTAAETAATPSTAAQHPAGQNTAQTAVAQPPPSIAQAIFTKAGSAVQQQTGKVINESVPEHLLSGVQIAARTDQASGTEPSTRLSDDAETTIAEQPSRKHDGQAAVAVTQSTELAHKHSSQPVATHTQQGVAATSDVKFFDLPATLPALDDATEQQASIPANMSDDAVHFIREVDSFYMDCPLWPASVAKVSAYRRSITRAQEIQLLVHRGWKVAHQHLESLHKPRSLSIFCIYKTSFCFLHLKDILKQPYSKHDVCTVLELFAYIMSLNRFGQKDTWACKEQVELDLWPSFVVEAQQ